MKASRSTMAPEIEKKIPIMSFGIIFASYAWIVHFNIHYPTKLEVHETELFAKRR